MSTAPPAPAAGLTVLESLPGDERVDSVLARIPGHDVPRVVRVVKASAGVDVEAFLSACASLSGVSHPALLPVLGFGRMADQRGYVITAQPDSVSLTAVSGLPLDGLVGVFGHAASALAAVHAQGLTFGGRLGLAEVMVGPPVQLDASLAGLAPRGDATEADVQALVAALDQASKTLPERPQFEQAVLTPARQVSTAQGLADLLGDLQSKWHARTEVSGKFARLQVEPQEPDLSGTALGPWQLERVLGEGAMGKVYLGRHARIGREAAVKVLKAEHAKNAESVGRFIQEATAVNAIKNEHIVEVSDFGEQPAADGTPTVFCVMELLEGRSLADAIDAGPFTITRAAKVTRELSLALHAAHQLGVVHRDVKPENVFLHRRAGDSEFVKVLDFGVAKLLKPLGDIPRTGTQAGIVIGTPDYMAPEQALGGTFDYRVDLWAVGVVLYELLAGRRPFLGSTFGQLVVELTTKPPPGLGDTTVGGEPIPPSLERLVMRCLARKPEDRYESGEALAKALEPFSTPEGLRALLGEPDPQAAAAAAFDEDPSAMVKRSRTPMVVALVVVALALAGGAAVLFSGGEAPPAPAAVTAEVKAPTTTPVPPPVETPKPPPAPTRVWLEVATTPPGATVTQVDGNAVLGKTPLKVELDRRDSLGIKLELDGHVPVVRDVPFSANVALQIDLEKLPPPKPAVLPKKVGEPKKGSQTRDSTVDPFNP